MPGTWRSGKDVARRNIRDRIYAFKKGQYAKYLTEMNSEDVQEANREALKEAAAMADIITEEVYAWHRKTRKMITTIGSPATQTSLPVSVAPDAISSGVLWGLDPLFDLENPEN